METAHQAIVPTAASHGAHPDGFTFDPIFSVRGFCARQHRFEYRARVVVQAARQAQVKRSLRQSL